MRFTLLIFPLNSNFKTAIMRKFSFLTIAILLAATLTNTAYAQSVTITGTVRNSSTNDLVSAVSVVEKGYCRNIYFRTRNI